MALRQLEKTYEPRQVEERWYQFWISKGYFHADVQAGGTPDAGSKPYSIVIPPPNITGSLHVGHALNNSLQDILIRWRRMQGRSTLWMPGTDHAGIATQNVVERQLKEEGLSRESLGRERFIQRVKQWKDQYGNRIVEQLKRLGASCDWARLRFTMDDGLSKAVREVFVRLHEEGLIYRGERLINWCPRCLTALSDIEVEHEETKGKLYHIDYPLVDDPDTRLTVATTRPETMLADTAVAVHPEDERYKHLIGKKRVRLPLTSREIPVVGDPIMVDREFGTGVVKITPAHDFNDFEAGERHRLPRLAILDQEAKVSASGLSNAQVDSDVAAALAGKSVAQARPLVVDMLKERGVLNKTDDHKMALGKCYRCKTVVEPYLSPQWFVKIKPLTEPAIKAVEDGRIRMIPEGWTNNYLGWMRDIKDWCISRQIWWGHQIPAWYCMRCHQAHLRETGHGVSIAKEATPIVSRQKPDACPACGSKELIQDPDVLDTWFSSALWPFSTLGWPEQTPELKTYYPTSTLVTGLDILFFWVARMIMMGLHFTGQVPFRDVYVHALVRDAEGQKMSKSKGNVIDPLHVMEQYGTDALRFTLASLSTPGRDVKLVKEQTPEGTSRAPQIEGYRNFANKIWNAARFILMHLDQPKEAPAEGRPFADRWILSRLNETIQSVNSLLEQYRFDLASRQLYQFIWHEYCDWYLEMIKPTLQDKESRAARQTRQTLLESCETLVRLLHPFMPFISEEIWQALPHQGDSIVKQPYPIPTPGWTDKEAEAVFSVLEQFVTTARTGRSLLNYQPGKTVTVYGAATEKQKTASLEALRSHLATLSRGRIELSPLSGWPANVLRLTVENLTVGLEVEGDVDLQKALDRILKQMEEGEQEMSRVEAKLGNAEFTAKAPPDVVTEHMQRLQTIRHEQTMLADSAEQVRAMMRSR